MNKSEKTFGNERFHYVDWLRVLTMLAVFILHCSRFFDYIGWHVKNPQTYMGFTIILLFFHQWTMPLFFLISGAASWFFLQRHSGRKYARARFKRLLIPYIFGILVIIPPQKFLEAVNQRNFSNNYFEFLGQYFSPGTLWIDPTLRFFGYYGYHLWFLGFLLVFSIIALPLFKSLRKDNTSHFIIKWGSCFYRTGRIFLFFLPIAIVQIILRPLFPQYLNWADTIYWALFFISGYLIFSRNQFGDIFTKYWKAALVVGIGCFFLLLSWAYFGNIQQMETNPGYSLQCFYSHLNPL